MFSILSAWGFYKMGCQTRELEQIVKNMTWTCLLQLLSQGNSASTCQGSFLRCFYFVFYWLEALGQGNSADTCQGSFLCCSALTNRCSMNSKVPVMRSSSGRCLGKMHLVPAGTPGGACQVLPASRIETLLCWIVSDSSLLLTAGLR